MFQESLFTTNELEPLASRMRPESLRTSPDSSICWERGKSSGG